MNKTILSLMATAAIMCSCEHIELAEEVHQDVQTKQFTFHVKGDFSTSFEEMTRAAVRLENDNTADITDIWVLDYVGGVLEQQVHQSKDDADFGYPKMSLSYGQHDIKFVASKGTSPSLAASSISWSKVLDTFTLDYPVDVTASSNGNRAPELMRQVGGVKLIMTDAVPANAASIELTMKRSMTFALPSLTASELETGTNTVSFPSSWVSRTGGEFITYTLCPSDEFTTDVRIRVIAEDNSIISDFTLPAIPIKKNRLTCLKGEVFGRGNGFHISLETTWDEPIEVTF